MAKKIILGEEIESLLEGSMERQCIRVSKAIREATHKLFGKNVTLEFAATFKDRAIVVVEETNDVFSVRYDTSAQGEIFPLCVEQLSVPTYTPDQYASKHARAYVDAFMGGARNTAQEHFQSLLKVAGTVHAPTKTAILAERLEKLVSGERKWKQVFAEKQAQIQESAGDLSGLEAHKTRVKFKKLYDGSITESELPKYELLVTADLKYLQGRLDGAARIAEEAVAAMDGKVPALQENEADPTLQMFRGFAEDFVSDIRGVTNSLAEAAESTNRLDVHARLYDILASDLYRYEVASNFIAHQARRLGSASSNKETK